MAKPRARKARDLRAACATGDTRKALEAMRDDLADALGKCDPAVKAQIAGQLRGVLRELDGLPDKEQTSVADELAQRRRSRRSAASRRAAG